MRYLIASKAKAHDFGIVTEGHHYKDGKIILNEKEVMFCPTLRQYETLEAKAQELGAEIYDMVSIKETIKKGDWKI